MVGSGWLGSVRRSCRRSRDCCAAARFATASNTKTAHEAKLVRLFIGAPCVASRPERYLQTGTVKRAGAIATVRPWEVLGKAGGTSGGLTVPGQAASGRAPAWKCEQGQRYNPLGTARLRWNSAV